MDLDNIYKECFFFEKYQNCGPHSRSKKVGTFFDYDLNIDISDYLKRISMKIPDSLHITEKELICSRSGQELPKDKRICAKHRYDFGIYWKAPTICLHPQHNSNKKVKGLRGASMSTYKLICEEFPNSNFPIGGPICPQHRDYFLKKTMHVENIEEIPDSNNDPDFEVPNCSLVESSRRETNIFLHSATEGVSPIKFQLKSPISNVSKSTIRYMKRKYTEATESFKATLSKKMAPEQEQDFRNVVSDDSSCSDYEIDEMTKEIISAFQNAHSQKMKFAILSLMNPDNYTKAEVANMFDCSQTMVKRARKLRTDYAPGNLTIDKKIQRNRLDMHKVDHFLDFLFSTDALQDVAYGTTTLKYDCGQKQITAHAVLTALKTHVVHDYLQFCENVEFVSLSKASLMRLLNCFNPSQRRFLSGLDNTTSDGLSGFSTLYDVVKKLDIDLNIQKQLIEKINRGKRYLKISYKINCKFSSVCASHCAQFSLSSPDDIDLKATCDHIHKNDCIKCQSILSFLDEIFKAVISLKECSEKDEILYDFNIAKKQIMEYMRHIMRGVQQDKAKILALDKTDEETGFWLQDWSQKILPQHYREKQQDYFGKRGISMHVDVFIICVSGKPEKAVYFTVLERCDQDALSTLCVSQHVLKQFIIDFPGIKKLCIKTDNAGCYSGSVCAESRYILAKQLGLKILRYDYNEPHRGKDQADRESAVAKLFIRSYLSEGHDVASANNVYDALTYKDRIKNGKVSVIEIDKELSFIESIKIPDIQSYHSIEFDDEGMTFWKYFAIGKGKKIPYNNLNLNCNVRVVCPFSPRRKTDIQMEKQKTPLCRKFLTLMFCPEDNCLCTFENAGDLSLHVAKGEHQFPKIITSQDKARDMFAKKMQTIVKKQKYEEILKENNSSTEFSSSNSLNIVWDLGWGLKPKRIATRLNKVQKDFLQECFKGKDKLTAQRVVELMRTLTIDGRKKFKPNEYITREQVMSYFSRMTVKNKKNISAIPLTANDAENPTTDDDDEVDENMVEENHVAEIQEMREEIKQLANKDSENELQPHSFYAVMYDRRFYIGKLLEDCRNNTFRMKFLHQRGLEEFMWPIRDDIEVVHRSTIFYGPVELTGAGPFKIPSLQDIQDEYKKCCGK